uniref:Ribosomal protein L23 n=1 Tax=Cassytha filiformis TaxID=121073 RepID=A0A385G1R7_9MAGN|nr:ribosomal protein L23 [Cassytha filiformis]
MRTFNKSIFESNPSPLHYCNRLLGQSQ